MKSIVPLLIVFIFGIYFHEQLHDCSFIIIYLVTFMLFITFLDMKIDRTLLTKGVWLILLCNISIAFLAYFVVCPFDSNLALAAFITGITPTAASAPAFTSFLKGKVSYVASAVVVTNCAVGLILAFVLPLMFDIKSQIFFEKALLPVLMVVFTPLGLAQLIRGYAPNLKRSLLEYKKLSYYCWWAIVFLAISKATNFLSHESSVPLGMIILIAFISLIICIINFSLGSIIGSKTFSQEAKQSLGQKNTSLTIWISLTFINPIVTLGPIFYVFFHNIYNSYQLYVFERKATHVSGIEEESEKVDKSA